MKEKLSERNVMKTKIFEINETISLTSNMKFALKSYLFSYKVYKNFLITNSNFLCNKLKIQQAPFF